MTKKTNILIPEIRFPEFVNDGEWKESVLEKITSSIFDGTHQTPTYTEKGIPFFSVENIVSGNKNKFISEDDYKIATAKNKPEKGDILITRIGNIGFSVIIDWDYEFSIYVTLACIKQSPIFNSHYLHSYFQSDSYQKEILSKSLLNAAPRKINMNELRETKVLLPNLQEQQRIASCLFSLDELILAHIKKLDTLKDHKKGLMQNLFPQEGETVPKYRFPEFVNDSVWAEKTIGDFIDSHKGGAPLTPSDFVAKSEYEVIPKKAICEGMWLRMESPTFCTEDFYFSNEQSIVDSTYLITTLRDLVPSGPNIGYIVKYKSDDKYILAQGVYGLKTSDKLIPEFLIHFSNSVRYRKLVNAIMVGSTQVHIRNGEFFNLPISVPVNIDEQDKIASCLSSLEELITTQLGKIEQLKLYKKGLMQGLFPKNNN
jgi:type I restriction enzyme S subunit